MPFDQLEQYVDPLLRRQVGIESVVRFISVFETTEYLNNATHVQNSTMFDVLSTEAPIAAGRGGDRWRTFINRSEPFGGGREPAGIC